MCEHCERSEDKTRGGMALGNTEISEPSRKIWTGQELLALINEYNKRNISRGSYKKREPYEVYTCKLPKNMKEWLRAHDGSTLIRKIIRTIMNEDKNSVIPPSIYPSVISSLSSQSSQNPKLGLNEIACKSETEALILCEKLNRQNEEGS